MRTRFNRIIPLLIVVFAGAFACDSISIPGASGSSGGSAIGVGINWGFPFRPGIPIQFGTNENHLDSRLHDNNYASITDESVIPSGKSRNDPIPLKGGREDDYVSTDIGAVPVFDAINTTDVKDENALALAPGTVLAVQRSCNAVLIDYGKDTAGHSWWGIFLHLDAERIWVKRGDHVVAGTPIGVPTTAVQNCMQASGYQHVHFAFLEDQQYVTMRHMRFCGFEMSDNGLIGLQGHPDNPPVAKNFYYNVPSTCPAEQPMTNVLATNSSGGYRVLRGEVTGLSAQWRVPVISGNANDGMNVGITIGCWKGNSNMATPACAGIFTAGVINANLTKQYYIDLVDMNGEHQSSFSVTVGDDVVMSLTLVDPKSLDTWQVHMTNLTHIQNVGATLHTNIKAVQRLSALYPSFDVGGINNHPYALFGDVHISNVRVRFGTSWQNIDRLPYQRTELFSNGRLIGLPTSLNNNAFTIHDPLLP